MSKSGMSKRVSGVSRICQQSGENALLTEYAVALSEKTKLETENALLKINLQGQQDNYTKLAIEHEQAKEDIQKHEGKICHLKQCLKRMEGIHKSEECARKSLEVNEEKLKSDVSVLKEELQSAHEKLNELVLESNKWKEKGKEYKERLRYCVKILESCNFGKTLVCDKECQTKNRRRKPSPVNYLESVEYDERILSEIFYKSNPFLDSL